MNRALVRGVPERFPEATVRQGFDRQPGLARARDQHQAYVAALRAAGAHVRVLPPNESPDCCFIEDQAVIFGGRALVTRSGHPARRSESNAVRQALASSHDLVEMSSNATLDGGDVLRVGDVLYVGVSERTDLGGVAELADAFRPLGLRVVEVPVSDALHLKCYATAPSDGLVVVAPDRVNPSLFSGCVVLEVPAAEDYAANVVAIDRTALVARGYPTVSAGMRGHGFAVVELDMDEFERADGSLTCLSLLW